MAGLDKVIMGAIAASDRSISLDYSAEQVQMRCRYSEPKPDAKSVDYESSRSVFQKQVFNLNGRREEATRRRPGYRHYSSLWPPSQAPLIVILTPPPLSQKPCAPSASNL